MKPADDALWLRQSTTQSWSLCPGRVMLSDREGFNSLPSEPMSFGTLLHEMIADELANGQRPWTRNLVVKLWEKLVRDEYGVELQELAPDGAWNYESAEEAISALFLWREVVKPTLPKGDMLIEQRLEAPIGTLPNGREVWLHGTGDLLYTDSSKGYDWKTSGRDWKPQKAQFLEQPCAYNYLHEWNHGVWVEEWGYWVYDRGAAKWREHTTSRTRQEVTSWLRHVMGIAVAIDAGACYYTPTQSPYGKTERGWWCSPKYCGAWDVCPGKWLNDDVDETQKGIVTWA